MKLSALNFANAAGLTGAILWIACAFVAIALPGLYQTGADLLGFGSNIGHFNLGLMSAVFGEILFTLTFWISGYLFGWSLTIFSKK